MKLGYEEELECKQNKVANFRHKWEETHVITYRYIHLQQHNPDCDIRRRTTKLERAAEESGKSQQICNVSLSGSDHS